MSGPREEIDLTEDELLHANFTIIKPPHTTSPATRLLTSRVALKKLPRAQTAADRNRQDKKVSTVTRDVSTEKCSLAETDEVITYTKKQKILDVSNCVQDNRPHWQSSGAKVVNKNYSSLDELEILEHNAQDGTTIICPVTPNGKECSSSKDNFLCEICGKDIASYNVTRRMQHLNRCCDKMHKKTPTYPLDGTLKVQAEPVYPADTTGVYFCHICGKELSKVLAKSRVSHLKHCTKKHQVSPYPPQRITQKELPEDKSTTSTSIAYGRPKHSELNIIRSKFFTSAEKDKSNSLFEIQDTALQIPDQPCDLLDRPEVIKRENFQDIAARPVLNETTLSSFSRVDPAIAARKRKKATKGAEPVCKEQEDIMLAVALSLSERHSQAPAEVFDGLGTPGSTPRDLAGFLVSEIKPDTDSQQQKTNAMAILFPESNGDGDPDISPTPKFSESLLAKRRVNQGLSLWSLSSTSTHISPTRANDGDNNNCTGENLQVGRATGDGERPGIGIGDMCSVRRLNETGHDQTKQDISGICDNQNPYNVSFPLTDSALNKCGIIPDALLVAETCDTDKCSKASPVFDFCGSRLDDSIRIDTKHYHMHEDKSSAILNSEHLGVTSTNENSEYEANVRAVLQWYSSTCEQKKRTLEEQLKCLELDFYSEIGRLTMEKEKRIAQLREDFNVPLTAKVFVDVCPLSLPQFPVPILQNDSSKVSTASVKSYTYALDCTNGTCTNSRCTNNTKLGKKNWTLSLPVVTPSNLPTCFNDISPCASFEGTVMKADGCSYVFNMAQTPPRSISYSTLESTDLKATDQSLLTFANSLNELSSAHLMHEESSLLDSNILNTSKEYGRTDPSLNSGQKPYYERMHNTELKKLMAKFGMKAGPKQFMLAHLNRVWQAMQKTNSMAAEPELSKVVECSIPSYSHTISEVCNAQQISEVCNTEHIIKYIRNDPIYEQILQYKIIDFNDLLMNIKSEKLKFNKLDLEELLDKMGVGYVKTG